MPTPLLVAIALLMLVVQILPGAFTKPLWQTVLFTIGINLFITGLYYAAMRREEKKAIFLPELSQSTKAGVKAILRTILMCIGAFFVIETLITPLLFSDPAPANLEVATRVWPTFIFMDAVILLVRRWRINRKTEQRTEQVPI